MSGRCREVYLRTGDYFFGDGNTRISTVLGTCVAITLWHQDTRSGGMCHYLLPTRASSEVSLPANKGMYADQIIELFVEHSRRIRARPGDCVVKLFGGGNMFPARNADCGCRSSSAMPMSDPDCTAVGCLNVRVGRELLAKHGFHLSAQDVGGVGSRHVCLELWSGDVWVRRGTALRGANEARA
jgi:chemotaxis protein CheD